MPEDKKVDLQNLRERIGRHLRTADEHTRAGRYDDAIKEIQFVLEIDPRNNYARSFLERVKLLQKRTKEVEVKNAPMAYDERMALVSQHLSLAEMYINKKDYKRALEEVAAVYKIDPKNFYAQTYSERIENLMLEEEAKAKGELAPNVSENPVPVPTLAQLTTSYDQSEIRPVVQQVETRAPEQFEKGNLLLYRELLKDFWFDGKITEEEARELNNMRTLFGITMEEHNRLEREVKINAYVDALRIAWRDRVLSEVEERVLQMMREKYNISPEEQKIAEARYNELKAKARSRVVILIVDPNRENLVNLNKIIKQYGYAVFIAQKAEDAMQIVNTQPLNCIISEIIFPKGQMDGIELLKKVREKTTHRFIPFFLMSAIADKKVINATYRLGADHFLKKPIDVEELVSVLEGKLNIVV